MKYEIRPCADRGDFAGAVSAIFHYFGGPPKDDWIDSWLRYFEVERMHAVFDDGALVAGGGAFSFELTVPGGTLPTAGVTIVGVLPTHRRRGILRELMRVQIADVHERGEPLAALWASEAPIYRPYGYGLASLSGEIDLPRERTTFRKGFVPRGTARLVSLDEALEHLPPVYDRVRLETPGMYGRSRAWWEERRFADPPERRQGGGEQQRLIVELDGTAEAYALYRVHFAVERFSPTGHVQVLEAMGATPQATADVWRFLLDIDWTARVKASLLPLDHPLLLLLEEPRRAGLAIGDALWLRLVDVGKALSGRAYAGDGEIVFELVDEFCPWNEGRWLLAGGEAERTEADPDLRLDVADLASVYLGAFTFAELGRAGRLDELRAGAVDRADGLFRTDRLPWCPEIF